MKKHLNFALSVACIATSVMLTGCGASKEEKANDKSFVRNERVKDGRTEIVFWTALGGDTGIAVQKVVDNFNASQNDYLVNPIFQGDYGETINKYRTTLNTNETPTLVMANDATTSYMIEEGGIVPLQEYIDLDGFDTSNFNNHILNYYTVDGNLYSMPFGASTALLFYNKDLFDELNIEAPKSYSDVMEASRNIITRDDNGNIEKYGIAFDANVWGYFEQGLANNNLEYVDNGNGRSGVPKSIAFNKEDAVNLKWIDDMFKEGITRYYPRSDINSTFMSGVSNIIINSSSNLRSYIDSKDFEVGVAMLPNESGDFNAALIGGNSIWLTESSPESEREGAWKFLKFMVNAESQAILASGSGYFPVNNDAIDHPLFKETIDTYPQFAMGMKQLNNSMSSKAGRGALTPVLPEIRMHSQEALEKIFTQSEEFESIIENMIAKQNSDIERYNMLNN